MRLEIHQGNWVKILSGNSMIYKGKFHALEGIDRVSGRIESVSCIGLEKTEGISICIPKDAKIKFNEYKTAIEIV